MLASGTIGRWHEKNDKQGKFEGLNNYERPRSISARVTWQFDGWHRKRIGYIFYTTPTFVHHFKSIGEFKLDVQSWNSQFWWKLAIFFPCDLEIWRMTLKNNRAPLLYYISVWASFHSHQWIQTGVTVRESSIRVTIGDFVSRVTLKFDGWPWKNNRAHFLSTIKLCATFHCHMWI